MLLFDMASKSDQELLYVEYRHPAMRYPLVNCTTLPNNQLVAATHTSIHGYPSVYCNAFTDNQLAAAIHSSIHGYPSVFCNNQLVAASHGLISDLMPRKYNWFGLKILLYPIFWILKNIYYAGKYASNVICEYATKVIGSYTSKKGNDLIILFFKRMICTCKKFQEIYKKQNTLYKLLEQIINNGTEFILNDLSEVNLFYNEIRNKIFKKQLPDIQNVKCWSTKSSLFELERSKNDVKNYIEGIHNVSEYHKKDLFRRLEIVMTHFKFIEKVLTFEKIVKLQDYSQIFDWASWRTQEEEKKDKKSMENELKNEFEAILSLIKDKKSIEETIRNINNEPDQNLQEEDSRPLQTNVESYQRNNGDNPDPANNGESVNPEELTHNSELDKQSNPP